MTEIINSVCLKQVKRSLMTSYLQFLSNVYRNDNNDTKNAEHVRPLSIYFGKQVAMIYFRSLRTIYNRNVMIDKITSNDFFSHFKYGD